MSPQICRVGYSGEAVVRKALSPRRSAFKGLLKKGMAVGKENSSGQTESLDPVKLKQLHSQALSEVAAAVGVAAVHGSDLKFLCLQVRPGDFVPAFCLFHVEQRTFQLSQLCMSGFVQAISALKADSKQQSLRHRDASGARCPSLTSRPACSRLSHLLRSSARVRLLEKEALLLKRQLLLQVCS